MGSWLKLALFGAGWRGVVAIARSVPHHLPLSLCTVPHCGNCLWYLLSIPTRLRPYRGGVPVILASSAASYSRLLRHLCVLEGFASGVSEAAELALEPAGSPEISSQGWSAQARRNGALPLSGGSRPRGSIAATTTTTTRAGTRRTVTTCHPPLRRTLKTTLRLSAVSCRRVSAKMIDATHRNYLYGIAWIATAHTASTSIRHLVTISVLE